MRIMQTAPATSEKSSILNVKTASWCPQRLFKKNSRAPVLSTVISFLIGTADSEFRALNTPQCGHSFFHCETVHR